MGPRDPEARRSNDIRRHNASSVLTTRLDTGPLPRVDLAAALTLTTGALTRITAEMVDAGLLHELEPLATTDPGRRRIPIDVNADRFLVAGVHVGLEFTTSGLVDLRGRLVGELDYDRHPSLSPTDAIDQALSARARLADRLPTGARLVGTGFISGGFVARGDHVFADDDRLGWHPTDMTVMATGLGDDFEIDDAYRAHSRAEMWFGAARDVDSFIQLFLGSLPGAAVVVDRQHHDGHGGRAGAFSHIPVGLPSRVACVCGREGCLQSVAGRDALLARAADEGMTVTSPTEIMERAEAGDDACRRVTDAYLDAHGRAIAVILDILDPERVVLAGAFRAGTQLGLLREAVRRYAPTARDLDDVVVGTALGTSKTANVVAAATARLATIYADPLAAAGMTTGTLVR